MAAHRKRPPVACYVAVGLLGGAAVTAGLAVTTVSTVSAEVAKPPPGVEIGTAIMASRDHPTPVVLGSDSASARLESSPAAAAVPTPVTAAANPAVVTLVITPARTPCQRDSAYLRTIAHTGAQATKPIDAADAAVIAQALIEQCGWSTGEVTHTLGGGR